MEKESGKRTKRFNGDGSITLRKDGRWMVRITKGFRADGKRNVEVVVDCLFKLVVKIVQNALFRACGAVFVTYKLSAQFVVRRFCRIHGRPVRRPDLRHRHR